ncbi:MAG: Hsp70 family protein [Alphaproteobacteria bacterium]|nr:Hsp70 family protein [Alphaproteobacteria bacterium]
MHAAGLDFGTSNSAIGIVERGEPLLVPLEGERPLIPSALFFDAQADHAALYGTAAIDAYTRGEDGRFMRALKSILGTSLMREYTMLGNRRLVLMDVVAMFVRHLKLKAEERLGAPIDAVVHGRPVRFADGDDGANKLAEERLAAVARRVGFQEISFTYEPVAAAYHYEREINDEEIVLIADLGGGTADFSVLRIGPRRRRRADRTEDILGNTGVRVGGTDFDRDLSLAAVMPLLGLGTLLKTKSLPMPRQVYADLAWWPTIHFCYQPRSVREARELLRDAAEPGKVGRLVETLTRHLGHRIAFAAERAKIALSMEPETQIDLSPLEAGLHAAASEGLLHGAIDRDLRRLQSCVQECLRQAGVESSSLSSLFLTGGTSRLPVVRAAIQALCPGARVARGDDFLSVAAGLTIEAKNRYA